MNALLLIGSGWAAMAVVMALLWRRQRRTGNAGIVDVAWTFGVGALAALFALGVEEGLPARRAIIAAVALAWSWRLGVHLARRVAGEPEDGRYRALRERWGDRAERNLFLFFQVQASWTVLFALPAWLAARNDAPLGWGDALGVAIALVAMGGEAIADRQLAAFRRDPAERGGVCRRGLWGWSRHPNYFFEWTFWWAFVAFGIAGPLGWLTLLAPATMLLFLLFITGIPPTEARAVASRGEAYRRYQREVSAFVPLPPRRDREPRP